MARLLCHLDVFYDNSKAFADFLRGLGVEKAARSTNLRFRTKNVVHSKRFGIPLSEQELKVPEVSNQEFYDLFLLSSANGPVRFVEFEPI